MQLRALAKSIHVNVITVQKAYEDLQRDGFIETTVGRGSFVSTQDKELQQITKTFPKSNFTLDKVSFSLPYGAILGFVGENGA